MDASAFSLSDYSGGLFHIGLKYGQVIRPVFAKVVDQYAGRYLRPHDPARVRAVKEDMEAYLRAHAPGLVEEMRGISEGSGVSFDDVCRHNLCSFIHATLTEEAPVRDTGCTSIGFSDSDRGPLLGKNTDCGDPTPDNLTRFAPMLLWRPSDGPAFIGNTHMGTVWRHVGINDRGLALGGSSVSGGVGGFRPGLTDGFLGRLFLERCATVEEAVALAEAHPFVGQGVNFIVSDQRGDVATFELSVEGKVVERLNGRSHLFTSNFYASGRLRHGPTCEPWFLDNSKGRRDFLAGLQPGPDGKFRFEQMEQVLRHHGEKGGICQHTDRNRMSTTFSTIALCREKVLLTAWGKPCGTAFQAYGF